MDLAPTTPEQRAEIYEDVRSLIAPGFLAHPVAVGEVRLCLRSLDPVDWEVLQYRIHGQAERQWKSWLVASSVWLVDGVVILGDENALWSLYKTCEGLPTTVLNMLYSALTGLTRRATKAYSVLEAFLYESESRRLWKTEGPSISEHRASRPWQRFHNPLVSLWVYYNQMEDHREQDEHDWQLVKFSVGPHAPKSIKKLSAQDRQRDGDMLKRRQRVMDKAYYVSKGFIEPDPEVEGQSSIRHRDEIRMAETPDELRESMRRWVAGIKDDHDLVVDRVKSKIKHDVEERRHQQKMRRQALDAALAEEGFTRNQPLPLSGDAGQKFLDRMKERLPGASVVVEDRTHNRAYSKYIENNPEIGDLQVDEEGNIVTHRPVTEDMLEVLKKPENPQGPSLQEQVEGRRPTAQFVDEEE